MAEAQEVIGRRQDAIRLPELILAAAVGLVIGIGSYTFIYARGSSYLTDDPAACANCHLMREQFDGWIRASHRTVAVCNDCHTPPGFAAKYATKAANGFWHSFAFTTGRFPEPLRITARNLRISELSCRKCHQDIVEAIEGLHRGAERLVCTRCHSDVGHL